MCMSLDVKTLFSNLHAILTLYSQKCDEIIVAHLGYLNYTQYNILVSFEGLEKLMVPIMNINFTVSCILGQEEKVF